LVDFSGFSACAEGARQRIAGRQQRGGLQAAAVAVEVERGEAEAGLHQRRCAEAVRAEPRSRLSLNL
jgi:hypothetical protein